MPKSQRNVWLLVVAGNIKAKKAHDHMKSTNRDLLVLLKDDSMSEQAIEHQVECLHYILHSTESADQFCISHELVQRNRITQKHNKLLRAISEPELKPFHFLIGKN